jgi:hypothetical protein
VTMIVPMCGRPDRDHSMLMLVTRTFGR